MKHDQRFALASQWQRLSRLFVLLSLILSALQLLLIGLIYRGLGTSEQDKLVSAACVAVAAIAIGLALAFRKSGAPTWRHKAAVVMVALPGAWSLVMG